MRPVYLFVSLLFLLALSACGSEEVLTPPLFGSVAASGSLGSTTILTAPSQDDTVTITGTLDDFAATLAVSSTVSGEQSVIVQGDGTWAFVFTPQDGANTISFTASDERGNINQMFLTLLHDKAAPQVATVTQSLDPTPRLIVTFNEDLLESSLATALFAVDATPVTADPYIALAPRIVTLPLSGPLTAGLHQLTCSGVSDLSTPAGNSIAAGYSFDFTIQ